MQPIPIVPPGTAAGLPPSLRARLWPESQEAMAYALLDAAADPGLADRLRPMGPAKARSLLPGGPATSAAEVAPWLIALAPGDPFTQALLHGAVAAEALLLLTSALALPPLWRHLRALGRARGPAGEPLWFRFHDPRVLRAFFATADQAQLAEMFGGIEGLFAAAEGGASFDGWAFVARRLHHEAFVQQTA